MHTFLKILANIYFWGYTLLLFIVWFTLSFCVWLLALPFDPKRRAFRCVLHLWCWLYLHLCPFWKFRIENPELLPRESSVFVANHQSLMDIVVLLGLNRHFKWVAKKELFTRPFVGWLLYFGRDISLDRSRLRDASRMLAACHTWLMQGISVLIFPEGHRQKTVGRFKLGAFQVAKAASVPLVPLVVSGPAQTIRGYFIEPRRIPIRIQVLPSVAPQELLQEPLETIAADVEERIRAQHRANLPELYA